MLFNSIDFLVFLPIVLLVYYIVPHRLRQIWLLAASYFFYMCWNAKYVVLLLFSTIVTYLSGIILERLKASSKPTSFVEKSKKLVVAICFTLNLGILFLFKYLNFATNLLSQVMSRFGISLYMPAVDILLPVGISFYTFQALGYTVDVYRNEIYAEKNFFRYALFVSFFPQLVAGPIERSKNLLKQLYKPSEPDFNRFVKGIYYILWGFFLKIVLADRIAIFVDTVYSDYENYAGCYLIVATVLFAIQIYCDFGGYSLIAVGSAEMLGISLVRNFDAPYFSVSVADFWRRWHISLTSWFRDYLYIPLGGGKRGKARKYLNKMIVFLVSGLWHGAALSFVAWGGINGLYQVIGEILTPIKEKVTSALRINREGIGYKLLCMMATFALIDFSWIFFRAPSLRSSIEIIANICKVHNMWVLFDGSLYDCGLNQKNFNLMLVCIVILLLADFAKYRGKSLIKELLAQDGWFQIAVMVLSILGIILFGIWGGEYNETQFIYFQF